MEKFNPETFDIRPRLPWWLSRFLGYRAEASPPAPLYRVYIWSFIGAFCGIALLQGMFGNSAYFVGRHVPPIVASYGASAVLCYGSIEVPLAQPRALMCGHFISAFIGICVSKVFGVSFGSDSNHLQWAAGAMAVAIAIVVMQATKTTHPPAGATALLPCIDQDVAALEWYYLAIILLSSTLILVTALLFNNIQRQYPKFWIAPAKPPAPRSNSYSLPVASKHEHQLRYPMSTSTIVDPDQPRPSGSDHPHSAISPV